MGELLARLEAMQARLDEQAARIAELEAGATAPALLAPHARAEPKVGRRGMLTKVLGATAAAAVLTVAKEAATAEAGANVTVLGPSTADYGIAATPGVAAPTIPPLNGTIHGVIGSLNDGPLPLISLIPPLGNSGVIGIANSGSGVLGISANNAGVLGTSYSNVGVYGASNDSVGVLGTSGNHVGLVGISTNRVGVYGASQVYGLWGQSTTGWGVYGEGTGNGAIGVYGKSGPNGGFAGYFNGDVIVTGRLFVNGVQVSTPSAARAAGTQGAPPVIEPKDVKPPTPPELPKLPDLPKPEPPRPEPPRPGR